MQIDFLFIIEKVKNVYNFLIINIWVTLLTSTGIYKYVAHQPEAGKYKRINLNEKWAHMIYSTCSIRKRIWSCATTTWGEQQKFWHQSNQSIGVAATNNHVRGDKLQSNAIPQSFSRGQFFVSEQISYKKRKICT